MSSIKIFNDPVHGFIEIPRNILLRVIDHPWFQRLRRVRQGGMNSLVYAGSTHTRFSHALGAMHLTRTALETLRKKGVNITEAEYVATLAAILLHDAGHGPFSHSLEGLLAPGVPHEEISLMMIRELNRELGGELDMAVDIFLGNYAKPFLHELISSQLDMDRMDYLMRDSFFTGVQEGIVGTERIIKTLNVRDGRLVVEQKGIYSAEKFIIARRLMYWQVYLHKTALSAEQMLVRAYQRARELHLAGREVWHNGALKFFFEFDANDGALQDRVFLEQFALLDDADITYALKQWQYSEDAPLRELAARLTNRRLLKIRLFDEEEEAVNYEQTRLAQCKEKNFDPGVLLWLVFKGKVSNQAYIYDPDKQPIQILYKDGSIKDVVQAADMSNIKALSRNVVKHYVCHPQTD